MAQLPASVGSCKPNSYSLRKLGTSQVLLFFPPGSINFYFADLACVLAGITTFGLPVSPCPKVLPPVDGVICDKKLRDGIPMTETNCSIEIEDPTFWSDLEPCDIREDDTDPIDSIYTVLYTCGFTGTPSPVPISRVRFLEDFSIKELPDKSTRPGCLYSYMPPCWATDRQTVYLSLFYGHRVGFSRQQPTLPQILEDAERLEPTEIVLPSVILQWMSGMDPPPSLGKRLEFVLCGGSFIGESMKR